MKIAYQSQQLQRLINSYPDKLDTATRKAMKEASKTISIAIKRDSGAEVPKKLLDVRVRHKSNKNSATVFVGLNITPFRRLGTESQLKKMKDSKPSIGVSLLGKTVAGSFVARGQRGNSGGKVHNDSLLVFIRNGGKMNSNSKKDAITQVAVGVEDVLLKNPASYWNSEAQKIFTSLAERYSNEVD